MDPIRIFLRLLWSLGANNPLKAWVVEGDRPVFFVCSNPANQHGWLIWISHVFLLEQKPNQWGHHVGVSAFDSVK